MGRLLSLVEDDDACLPDVMRALAPGQSGAAIIALTGAPGVGKSTTTSALVGAYRRQGLRVGVLAVDPSSPFSGGALLGDRIRMSEHAADPGVFIRSMASRGHLGGVSRATPQALRILDAAGFDIVLLETVGVGQSEVEVAGLADTTLVLVAPGMGDGIQAVKAGILEVADVLVVNKADRDGADATVRDLRHLIQLGDRSAPGLWRPRVIRAVANAAHGIDDIVEAVAAHRQWLGVDGLRRRHLARAAGEIEALALESMRRRLAMRGALTRLAEEVVDGRLDPYAAASALTAPGVEP